MKSQQERENDRKKLHRRLMLSFILALAATALLELASQFLTEAALIPLMKQIILGKSGVRPDELMLESGQILSLAGSTLLIGVLQGISGISPACAVLAGGAETAIREMLAAGIPQLADVIYRVYPTSLQAFLLTLTLMGIGLLLLIPVAVVAALYLWWLNREIDRVRQEEERDYAEIDRNRNLMLSDIAHDLRNPITVVAGCAKALNDGVVTDEKQKKEYLETIETKSLRINNLIELLFGYAKVNSAGFELNKEKIDLCELARETAADMYSDIENKNMELLVEIPDKEILILADRLQLSRVIANLLTNAVRYNPEGTKILLKIEPNMNNSGDTQLIVADSGIEIPKEKAEKLFEPFYRGDSARKSDGGSGLGLSIAKSIAEMHGFTLSLLTKEKPAGDIPAGCTKAFVMHIPW